MMLRVGDAAKRHCTPVAVRASASVAVAFAATADEDADAVALVRRRRRPASGAYCTTDAAVGSSVAQETRSSSDASPSEMRTCDGVALEPHSATPAHAKTAASTRRALMAAAVSMGGRAAADAPLYRTTAVPAEAERRAAPRVRPGRRPLDYTLHYTGSGAPGLLYQDTWMARAFVALTRQHARRRRA